ncbi:hypothetical protein [Novipirellula rosea]|uniref:Uncharacterized protein n=1 Tax=Novipirellula rosea TaxID=1031540 RepID=A0ABP8NRX0_9BACT|tara:strand:+ start:2917 stop:3774 length:858 start_codon:yes stop_codon:yes gene_type:complete
MRNWLAMLWLSVLLVFQILFGVPAAAQRTTQDDSASTASSVSKQLLASQTWPVFRSKSAPSRELNVSTILRYTNATRILNPDEAVAGLVMLCTDQGRPVAAIQVYAWDGKVCHELDLLARQPSYTASYEKRVGWEPKQIAVAYRRLPGVSSPSTEANRRLSEMKSYARRFVCTLTGWEPDDSDRQTLRLLPRPLYRYEISDSSMALGSFDGCVFAFAQGTDPEALLLIEAVRDSEGEHWEYGFSRATSGGLEATLGGAQVWHAEKYPAMHPQLPHFNYERPLQAE